MARFAFVSSAEFDHFRDLADDLHLQSIFGRADRNAFDQAAEDLERLIPNLWLIQSVLQPLNLASVDLGQIRNEGGLVLLTAVAKVLLELHPTSLKLV